MKAISISQPGPPSVLQFKEVDAPVPKSHEVLIRVRAAGINRPDIAQRKGHYPAPPGVPQDTPGLEVAGTIEKCGSEVTRWKEGQSVCALLGGGGYAEFAVADERHCLPIPKGWSFTEAASLPETVFTVWHNVFQRGQLKRAETFLVHGGSSGIGITAIQLAKAYGARVFCTAGSAAKCKACEELGADKAINYKEEDFEIILKDQPIDVILDMIGGDYTPKNLQILNTEGRLVFINAMKGKSFDLDILRIMSKRLSITGSTLRSRDANFKAELASAIEEHVWPILNDGGFKPVIFKTFNFEEAVEAHALMESSSHIGKIVLTFPEQGIGILSASS